MGTRHLIVVQKNGEYKVAQYGQFDGYPRFQGIRVLNFAKNLNNLRFRAEFEDKVSALEFASIDYINEIVTQDPNWEESHPELSRNTSAEILSLIMENPRGMKVLNDIDFAQDSSFCEWVYVIDLDSNTFECYKGFNSHRLSPKDRFYSALINPEPHKEYYGVKLVDGARWSLGSLPTKKEFLATFNSRE